MIPSNSGQKGGFGPSRGFSSEVETGSRRENASDQESGSPFRINRNEAARGSRGCSAGGADRPLRKARDSVSPADQNREPRHWFMDTARLDRGLESPTAQKRLGFAATFPQDVSTAPGRVVA